VAHWNTSGNKPEKPMLLPRRNKEQIDFIEFPLSFGQEYFFFQSAINKHNDKNIQNIILLLVLCGCKTWSLALREEMWGNSFENRVLRKIFGVVEETS
jgi:hypothetical protein